LLASIDEPDALIEIDPTLDPLPTKSFTLGDQRQPMTQSQLLEAIEGGNEDGRVLIKTRHGKMGIHGFLKSVPLVLFVSSPTGQSATN
jgi:hypothetical protein